MSTRSTWRPGDRRSGPSRPSTRGARVKSLVGWHEVIEPLNVWRAWRDYARGKRRRPAVARFALTAESQVAQLARELAHGTWRPGPYRQLRITDPKRRLIAAAPVRDRVVHHALHRVMAPKWNRSFIDHSYACLPGRGSHRAILRFGEGLRRHRYVLALDVRRYFYSVDRDVLCDLLWRRLREPGLRRLVAQLLDSGAGLYEDPEVAAFLGWDEPGRAGRGVPIGNLTSQWWGNVYLDGLDHHVQRTLRVPRYQRYMDDLTLMGDDREALFDARDAVADWLAVHRGLDLRDPWVPPRPTGGAHAYLGYVVSRAGVGPGRRMRQRAGALIASGGRPAGGGAARAVAAAWMWPLGKRAAE